MHASEVNPEEAWNALLTQPDAQLIDVRTEPEWRYVGEPDIAATGKSLVKISWHVFPDMTVNNAFIEELARAAPGSGALYFLCRSGGRSLMAADAATGAGFARAYSIAGGFEGPLDGQGHRGTSDGWKARNLPWKQS